MTPGSATHSTFVVRSHPGVRVCNENVRILNENVRTETQEFFNVQTGKTEFRTIEFKEQVLEREVGCVVYWSVFLACFATFCLFFFCCCSPPPRLFLAQNFVVCVCCLTSMN